MTSLVEDELDLFLQAFDEAQEHSVRAGLVAVLFPTPERSLAARDARAAYDRARTTFRQALPARLRVLFDGYEEASVESMVQACVASLSEDSQDREDDDRLAEVSEEKRRELLEAVVLAERAS